MIWPAEISNLKKDVLFDKIANKQKTVWLLSPGQKPEFQLPVFY